MDIRTNESPMDFQWQQGHGPAASDSPFIQASAQHHQHLNGFAGHKRPFNELQSPTKPSLPALREPASQTFLFPSTPSMKPPAKHSFTTPQRPIEMNFSSGPEIESSPGNADNEDTPELPKRSGLTKAEGSLILFASNKTGKKAPLLGSYNVSGRGEIPRKFYTDALVHRVQKNRRRGVEKGVRLIHRRGMSYDSDSDSKSRPSSREGESSKKENHTFSQPKETVKEMGAIPSIFHFMETHPNLPSVLSYYAQFLLNVFLVGCLMYMVYSFWSTIRSDVDLKSREVASETLAEMAVCTREYRENRCDRETRVPAMETVCNNWEKCMQQDPSKVGRARVSAHTFAEILNSFIEPISAKTMITSFILIFGCFAISNLTFSVFRNRVPPPHPSQYMHPPPPPQHHVAPQPQLQQEPLMYADQFYTPYQNQRDTSRPSYDDGRGGDKILLNQRSPERRLGYR